MAVCLGLLWLVGCQPEGKYEEVDREVGYRGLARHNPYLAAERLLEQLGYAVYQLNNFTHLTEGSVVITPVQSFLSYGDTQTALEWVRRGGHLIVLLSGGEQWLDDWSKSTPEKAAREDEEEKRFLSALNIEAVEKHVALGRLQAAVAGRKLTMEIGGEMRFSRAPGNFDVKAGNALVSFRRGSGRVTLLAEARPFRNRFISDADHAALLHSLVGLDGGYGVYFLNGARVSFFGMLWDRAWPAMTVLGVLLVAWLWRSLPRFGPTFTPPERAAREFTEQLRLAGNYLWQQREVQALLDPLQREARLALARRGIAADEAAGCAELTARTGLPADRVRLALFLAAPESPQIFLRTVQDLQTIRAKI